MQGSKYNFCGCNFEIFSPEPLLAEGNFPLFKAEFETADYSLEIIKTDTLPPRTGEPVFISDRRNVYVENDEKKEYTSYFNMTERAYVDFACKVNDTRLYVSFPGQLREHTVFDALNLPEMLLRKGIGILHCSYIEYNGEAILFAGEKQVGKSTQAALWEQFAGAQIINGDRAAIVFRDGRLYAEGIPFCGTSGICRNKSNLIKAVVLPSKGKENRLSVLSGFEAYASLLNKFACSTQNRELSDAASLLIQSIAENVPVFAYSCLKDESAVTFLKNETDKLK